MPYRRSSWKQGRDTEFRDASDSLEETRGLDLYADHYENVGVEVSADAIRRVERVQASPTRKDFFNITPIPRLSFFLLTEIPEQAPFFTKLLLHIKSQILRRDRTSLGEPAPLPDSLWKGPSWNLGA